MLDIFNKMEIPSSDQAIQGRDEALQITNRHFVNGNPLQPPFPDNMQQSIFGLGCFWGAERKFWQIDGVFSTAVGYAAGYTRNPTYEEVCTGQTGHNEVVLVIYDPDIIPYEQLLKYFWQSHNPTQGMQQGNDVGTQYRSGIYVHDAEQMRLAGISREEYQLRLNEEGFTGITTEILEAPVFYYAEDYHQQYLAKNPAGYCGLGGTGVNFSEVD
jgi:peptide-methionine (S)-S-oxide reductase